MMRDSKRASAKRGAVESGGSPRDQQGKQALNRQGIPSDLSRANDGRVGRVGREAKSLLQTLLEPKNRKFAIFSILVHLIIVIAFIVNWDSDNDKQYINIPKSMTVRAATAEELAAIANAKNKLKERQEVEKRKQELAKAKERENKRKKEAERKNKQEEIKRKNKAKKELENKKKAEAAKKKALEEEKRRAAQKAEEDRVAKEEKKRKEEIEKRAEEARLAAEKKRAEDKLRERIEEIKAIQAAKAAAEREQNSREKAKAERELTEVEYYMGVIRSRIENRWRVPPRTKGLRVVLRIKLLPTGELSNVSIATSSGLTAFDNSALHAVNNVGNFPVPKDSNIFERNFRTFLMGFTSPDDGL